jgi:hypothetical protein
MKTKMIEGSDERVWEVSRSVEWSRPAIGDDFEHDVDGGRGAAVLIISSLITFWVILFVWSPAQLRVPGILIVLGVLILAFLFPIRWWLRRQWTIVAETNGSDVKGNVKGSPEMWSGLVRGSAKAREEQRVVERMLRTQGTPAHADSPLQPVN